MDISTLFLGLALVAIAVYIVTSMMIVSEVKKRNIKINFFWLRLYIIKYAHQYKELSKKETGHVESLFYVWIISVNASLICAILGWVLR
ncbi:hypothetical protein JXA70_08905 [candidate division KSB1 bacterium]|nr:hypothetical protein [candidate division KSB1 bacterium]